MSNHMKLLHFPISGEEPAKSMDWKEPPQTPQRVCPEFMVHGFDLLVGGGTPLHDSHFGSCLCCVSMELAGLGPPLTRTWSGLVVRGALLKSSGHLVSEPSHMRS